MKRFIHIVLFLILIGKTGSAQTYVLIPDPNFVTVLNNTVPGAMSGNSLNITSTLVTVATTSLFAQGNNLPNPISNLYGVQYFTSLTHLECQYNNLSTLPSLPASLNHLYCNNNVLTSLPPLPNSLTVLSCYQNSLTALPALPNSLTSLLCSHNSLSTLPALPNSLVFIDCTYNLLTGLPALPTSLTEIQCHNNSLSSLPALPNSLLHLLCGYNNLTTMPTLPPSLITLACQFNTLTALPVLPASLKFLGCINNNIKCFPVFPSSLNWVYLTPNPFNCIPNIVLPAMASYTNVSICVPGNTNNCDVYTGINDINSSDEQFSVYPNPASNLIHFRCKKEETIQLVVISDVLGKNVLEQKEHITSLSIEALEKGVYQIRIYGNNEVYFSRFVKE